MKQVIMNDGTEQTVTDKHARNLVYSKLAEYADQEPAEEKEEKKVPANKADKTKKETK